MSNVVAISSANRIRPNIENRKVMPKRPTNAARRSREYLTPEETAGLIREAGKLGRHGLCVSDLVSVRRQMKR